MRGLRLWLFMRASEQELALRVTACFTLKSVSTSTFLELVNPELAQRIPVQLLV